MKKINLMMWQGLLLSVLALGFVSCDPDTPCPNRKGAEPNTSQGVTVMLEMENVETGETTRTALGDPSYSFTTLNGGGYVQVDGLRFYPKPKDEDKIRIALTYYGGQYIAFQGWSWRYGDDTKATYRDVDENVSSDYIKTPAIQPQAGVQKLNIDEKLTTFTCKYRPGKDNNVYVRVKYATRTRYTGFPNKENLDMITVIPPAKIGPGVGQNVTQTLQELNAMVWDKARCIYEEGLVYTEVVDDGTSTLAYRGWQMYYNFLRGARDKVEEERNKAREKVWDPIAKDYIVKDPYRNQLLRMELAVTLWENYGKEIERGNYYLERTVDN